MDVAGSLLRALHLLGVCGDQSRYLAHRQGNRNRFEPKGRFLWVFYRERHDRHQEDSGKAIEEVVGELGSRIDAAQECNVNDERHGPRNFLSWLYFKGGGWEKSMLKVVTEY